MPRADFDTLVYFTSFRLPPLMPFCFTVAAAADFAYRRHALFCSIAYFAAAAFDVYFLHYRRLLILFSVPYVPISLHR